MTPSREIPERRVIERALRAAGLSARQAKKLISGGWRALVDEREAEISELRAELDELRERLSSQAGA